MAKIKILLEKGETMKSAEDALHKALNLHSSGDVHNAETFEDSATQDLTNRIVNLHAEIYSEMISEIMDELDSEYSNGDF